MYVGCRCLSAGPHLQRPTVTFPSVTTPPPVGHDTSRLSDLCPTLHRHPRLLSQTARHTDLHAPDSFKSFWGLLKCHLKEVFPAYPGKWLPAGFSFTVLDCLLGKNFTNITYISSNGGVGKYCAFSKLLGESHH